ncbi:hypothetical protein B0J15DRAFT_517323 [Fusarium solani]|jgi:NAD(P)-dependent dehydrogenase (short-subunit alcohol dehydrogenase family)|uniref:Uncharacterized protein n=1 Tax=Fusarium solani TaxID=169388 RepID=A0A9P9G993_FUSSL|nr:uncharacterized protein B0J15DRAFT_517323 [Fusarium solani]KAH7234365.1 hypothetical protein B0J15DRAFT_517323 [Fusarium solani]
MGSFLSKSVTFHPDTDIPSLKGKVILVTGGNSGLGKQSILELAKHNPQEIWLGARSHKKAEEAINDIRSQVPNAPPIKPLQMDLASFESIHEAAKSFRQQSDRLDILLLNAGIMSVPEGKTKDGYEIQFGTNHMGHALLSKLLLPTLLKTAEQPGSDVRIVVLSSSAHQYAPERDGITFSTLKTTAEDISTITRYGQSKLANILFAQEFARRYPQIKVPSIMPGLVNTNLANTMSDNSFVMRIAWKITAAVIGVDVQTGALNQLWASTAANVKSGEYYTPVGKTGQGKRWTSNPELAKKLWDWTEKELEGEKL